jgi:predicted nucleic-acid-binding protein
MFCQVCGLKNSDEEEFCARCHSKLLVLSGVGVVEESGEPQEEIPFDEHLLERISTLEDVVKRTGEAVESLFESLGNLEKNLFVAHTGILALQETLQRSGAVRSEEVLDLWETKMDERMQAVEKKDRFLERRDRIIARFRGDNRQAFLRKLREAEFAILALDAERGIRVLDELFRLDRENTELGSIWERPSFRGEIWIGPPVISRKCSRSSRSTSSRSSIRGSRPRNPGRWRPRRLS